MQQGGSTVRESTDQPGQIAVVGLACRFPGAAGVQQFWQNLVAGVESIERFDKLDREPAFSAPAGTTASDDRVLAYGTLQGIEDFDHRLFGFSSNEAAITDPQQRLGLEVGLECLLDAGCDPQRYQGEIGIFAACSLSTYLINQILPDVERAASLGGLPLLLRNDKDHLATLLAYKLGLTGPAITVGTSCSSSLAAVHIAAQNLQTYQCDLALAGGVSILVPQRQGHLREEYGLYSVDGYCRVFDHRASGVVGGNGVGFVALKRLEDALADGDTIHAVQLGGAVNNDGSRKAGYTAPSAQRQAAVIATAHAVAGISAETVTMVEAHGTGTSLGDPIEIEALTQAFRRTTQDVRFCAIGSVKSNIGHLDAAAGIAGFIKTVLSLKHGVIPPTLHFERPNPHLDFDASPFIVNDAVRAWRPECGVRRAGVSAFGMGGTNVHLVLQEPPHQLRGEPWLRRSYLVPTSAAGNDSLDRWHQSVANALYGSDGSFDLGSLAFTVATARPMFSQRKAIVASDAAEFALAASKPARLFPGPVRLLGLFADPGGLHIGVHQRAYEEEAGYRREVDRLWQALRRFTPLPELVFAGEIEPHCRGARFALCLWAWGAWLNRLGLKPDIVCGSGWGIAAALAMAGAAEPDAILQRLAQFISATSPPSLRDWFAPAELAASHTPLLLAEATVDILAAPWRDTASGETFENPSAWLQTRGGDWLAIDPASALAAAIGEIDARGVAGVLGPGTDPANWHRHWLESLATIWNSGKDIDWSEFYDNKQWRRAALPNYAFSRTRCWFTPQLDRELPRLDVCADSLRARYRADTEPSRTMADHPALASGLEALCDARLWRAIKDAFPGREPATADEIAARIRLHPKSRRFFDWMLARLSAAGVLSCTAATFAPAAASAQPALSADPAGLIAYHQEFAELISLVAEFGDGLAVSLQEPAHGTAMFAAAMRDGRLGRALSELSSAFSNLEACCRRGVELIGHLAKHKPRLRVLEVGAGGLIFTQFMEPLLRAEALDYWVSDLSSSQVARARQILDRRSLAHVHSNIVDINRQLDEQGLDLGGFDVIVGLNVVHLSPDVRHALGNLREALTPGGSIILLETVDRAPWRTMIWGWAEGWWNCAEHRAGDGGGPLLDAEAWRATMQGLSPTCMISLPGETVSDVESDTILLAAQFTAQALKPRGEPVPDLPFGLPPKDPDPARWLFRRSFVRQPVEVPAMDGAAPRQWIVLRDASALSDQLVQRLEAAGHAVTQVWHGDAFRCLGDGHIEVRAGSREDFSRMLDAMPTGTTGPVGILHLWTADGLNASPIGGEAAMGFRNLGFHTIAVLAQAVGDGRARIWNLISVMRGLHDVFGTEYLCPHHAVTQAAMKVVPLEYPHIRCRSIDIELAPGETDERRWRQLLEAITSPASSETISLRGDYRWSVVYQPIEPSQRRKPVARLREGGRYVVFGGLGGVGYAVAHQLARHYKAKLLLVGRSVRTEDEATDIRLANLTKLGGAAFAFRADLTDVAAIRATLAEANQRYGGIDGVIHCAGVIDEGGVIAGRTNAATETAIAAKVDGVCNLAAALEQRHLDFLLLFSSIGGILHRLKFGEVGYVAGNDFLDAFARERSRQSSYPVQVIHWSDWLQDGMWARSRRRLSDAYRTEGEAGTSLLKHDLLGAMTDDEGFDVLRRVLNLGEVGVVVSTRPLQGVLDLHDRHGAREYGNILDQAGLTRSKRDLTAGNEPDRSPESEVADSLTSLRSIWNDVIGRNVTDDDDFFDVGGDSLLALRVISQVDRKFEVDLPLDVFFSSPVLRDMAAYIDNLRWATGVREYGHAQLS